VEVKWRMEVEVKIGKGRRVANWCDRLDDRQGNGESGEFGGKCGDGREGKSEEGGEEGGEGGEE
jgi:hypothetical protein